MSISERYEQVPLWKHADSSSELLRLRRNDMDCRPAMLVVPGGGYCSVCMDSEGYPVAERFERLGFQTFILRYQVAPHRYPQPQRDLLRAVKLIRANAVSWQVKPDQVAVCGFSAGGHLCAWAGVLGTTLDAADGDSADFCNPVPDALVLSYPVISFTGFGHAESGKSLLGDDFEAKKEQFSLERHVSSSTPPAFLWHTAEDEIVPLENSLAFAAAMKAAGRPFELHVFPHGPHGMQLGYGREDISQWPEQARAFLHGTCGFQFPERTASRRTVILTFDDGCKSHLETVAPILKKHHFGATFFLCRFPEEWRTKNAAFQLTASEIKQLADQGFEIGNHTWNHPDLRKLSDAECEDEINRLNDFLTDAGIPRPVSFAYPGGPFAPNAVQVISRAALRYGRTTEARAWNPQQDDPLHIPAIALQKGDALAFYQAVALATPEHPVVLVFHGVPDKVHDWVNTPPDKFAQFMEYLARNDYQVMSFRDYAEANSRSAAGAEQ